MVTSASLSHHEVFRKIIVLITDKGPERKGSGFFYIFILL